METDQEYGIEQVKDVRIDGETARIDLFYPRTMPVQFIEVGLMDVRASDSIRVSYDFDRDGWKIEQPTEIRVEAVNGVQVCSQEWKEAAFLPAWQFDERKDDV